MIVFTPVCILWNYDVFCTHVRSATTMVAGSSRVVWRNMTAVGHADDCTTTRNWHRNTSSPFTRALVSVAPADHAYIGLRPASYNNDVCGGFPHRQTTSTN